MHLSTQRHDNIVAALTTLVKEAGYSVRNEPAGLLPHSEARPADILVVGGGRGVAKVPAGGGSNNAEESRDLCVDVTIVHAGAASHQARARNGTLLKHVFHDKMRGLDRKVAEVQQDWEGADLAGPEGERARARTWRVMDHLQLGFLPFVLNTAGKLHPCAENWVKQLVRKAIERKNIKPRSAEASQRHVMARWLISTALQRYQGQMVRTVERLGHEQLGAMGDAEAGAGTAEGGQGAGAHSGGGGQAAGQRAGQRGESDLALQDAQSAFFRELGREDLRASRAAVMTGNALPVEAEIVLRGAQENARVVSPLPLEEDEEGVFHSNEEILPL